MPADTPTETFLLDFHNHRPGGSSRAFGVQPMTSTRRRIGSSYDALVDVVDACPGPLRVLDLACGDGHLLSLFAAGGRPDVQLSGIDMSTGELAAARRRLGDSVELTQGRAQALPFEAARFDIVTCHMALMLMDDVERVLAEVQRVLTPGGSFAAVVGGRPPESPSLACYRQVLSGLQRRLSQVDVRFGDPRCRTDEGLTSLFATAAFRPLVIEDFTTDRRLTPEAMWAWYLDLYDLYLFEEDQRPKARDAFMACVAPHVDSQGHLAFGDTYRLVTAASSIPTATAVDV